MKAFSILFSLFLAGFMSVHAESRSWTNSAGKKIEAEFVSSDGKTVRLKLANGKTANVPLQSLSKEDQDFISNEEQKQKNLSPEDKLLAQLIKKGNFDKPWPRDSRAPDDYEVAVIEEGPEEYIYETPNFRFISDAKIGKGLIKTLSKMFEATYEANKALPLGNLPWHVENYKFVAKLYENKNTYLHNGGLPGSAGVYMPSRTKGELGIVMVPFDSLGVKPLGSSYIIDRSKSASTLIHEITHQMMPDIVKRPAWFCEGSAEYVALSPYNNGKFNFNTNKNSILETVIGYGKRNSGGRGLGKDISAPSLKDFMSMPYSQFINSNPNLNYGLAPLITYYFYHIDGEGDAARIKKYIQALCIGKSEEDCLKILLDGRDWDELSKEISTFWKRSGISITFDKY